MIVVVGRGLRDLMLVVGGFVGVIDFDDYWMVGGGIRGMFC